ncbi:MAG: rhodanese-like domain-containing protein [Desulfofustis sp.]|jgi:rhodanese-related sulfurtransferase
MKRFLPLTLIALLLLTSGAWLLSGPSTPITQADEQQGASVGDGKQAVSAVEVQPRFQTVSAAEAAELMKRRENLQIIDVRTPQERKQFRIADSKLVPVGDVLRGVFEADPEQPLMLICAVGGRSYVASKVMFARGYREIYNLDGGIESWRRAGFPLESGPEDPAR